MCYSDSRNYLFTSPPSKIRKSERTYSKGDLNVGDLFQRNKIT